MSYILQTCYQKKKKKKTQQNIFVEPNSNNEILKSQHRSFCPFGMYVFPPQTQQPIAMAECYYLQIFLPFLSIRGPFKAFDMGLALTCFELLAHCCGQYLMCYSGGPLWVINKDWVCFTCGASVIQLGFPFRFGHVTV